MTQRAGHTIRAILLGAALAALAGCSVRDRAKALLVQQNRTLAALTLTISTVEERDPDLADRLYDTEDDLNGACKPLLQAGSRKLQNKEVGSELGWQVYDSLDLCEQKTLEVARLLWVLDPDSAGRYLENPHGLEERR